MPADQLDRLADDADAVVRNAARGRSGEIR